MYIRRSDQWGVHKEKSKTTTRMMRADDEVLHFYTRKAPSGLINIFRRKMFVAISNLFVLLFFLWGNELYLVYGFLPRNTQEDDSFATKEFHPTKWRMCNGVCARMLPTKIRNGKEFVQQWRGFERKTSLSHKHLRRWKSFCAFLRLLKFSSKKQTS